MAGNSGVVRWTRAGMGGLLALETGDCFAVGRGMKWDGYLVEWNVGREGRGFT